MPLDPQAQILLDTLAQSGAPELHTLPPSEARAMAAGFAAMGPAAEPVDHVEDLAIRHDGREIPVRCYRSDGGDARPVLVFLHGSGWMYGDLEMSDGICRLLAIRSGCVVVAPDYRLAPEHPYPAALDDVVGVLDWVARKATAIGGDPARIAVGGESAGGNLAAAAAIRARDRGGPALRYQVLICPVMDHDLDRESYREFADGYLLTRDAMRWLWDMYVPDPADRGSGYVAPLREPDLSALPDALVMTAEFDPLRDEGEAYAARLQAAGVRVEARRYDGLIHGFMTLGGVLDAGRAAIDDAASALRDALGTEGPAA